MQMTLQHDGGYLLQSTQETLDCQCLIDYIMTNVLNVPGLLSYSIQHGVCCTPRILCKVLKDVHYIEATSSNQSDVSFGQSIPGMARLLGIPICKPLGGKNIFFQKPHQSSAQKVGKFLGSSLEMNNGLIVCYVLYHQQVLIVLHEGERAHKSGKSPPSREVPHFIWQYRKCFYF